MTTEEARAYLTNHFQELINKIEGHYLLTEAPLGIAGKQDIDARLDVFQEINTRAFLRFISAYKLPPQTDSSLQLGPLAITAYLKGLYPYVVRNANTKYWKNVKNQIKLIPLDEYQEDHGEIASEECMEDTVDNSVMTEAIKKANAMFIRMMTPQERVVWELRLQNAPMYRMCSILYPDSKADQKTSDKVRYRIRLLEYRLACLMVARQIPGDKLALDGLNLYPSQNKKYLGQKKLEALPTEEVLLAIARGKKEEAKELVLEVYEPWAKVSKVDFNGKAHNHVVVYEKGGKLYDHVTKEWKEKE